MTPRQTMRHHSGGLPQVPVNQNMNRWFERKIALIALAIAVLVSLLRMM